MRELYRMWVSWQDFGKCFKMRHAHRARRPNALLRGDFNCKFLNKLQEIFGEGTGNVSHFGTRVAFCDSPHALGITASIPSTRRQSRPSMGPSATPMRFSPWTTGASRQVTRWKSISNPSTPQGSQVFGIRPRLRSRTSSDREVQERTVPVHPFQIFGNLVCSFGGRRQSPFEGGPSSSVSRFQIPEPDFRRKDLSDEDRR